MSRYLLPLALAAGAVLSTAGAAAAQAADPQPAAKADRQCFWTRNVSGYTPVDDQTVNVRVGVRDVYRMELMGICPDVDWSHQIGLVSRGGSHICTGLDATIVVNGPLGPQRCPVKSIRKLTPEEAAALSPKQKP
ncbi:MAG: DUF6491 family protein [Phenylobacterium sp.]|uniref:DUF6491 family protein n=1 Tax=Phenylobacterium sp. TaxID=1871053 RepID=UPI00391A5FEF